MADVDLEGGESDNLKEHIKPADVGWTIGGGVNVGKAVIDIRYTRGLLDIGREDAPPMNNQAISVMAGFRLRSGVAGADRVSVRPIADTIPALTGSGGLVVVGRVFVHAGAPDWSR
jgi:hypothetical protein